MGDTSIEWTHRPGTIGCSWNPTRGCKKISPGCKHCYAETFAERFRGVVGHPYEQGFDPRIVPGKLAEPLHWRKPRTVFVNSMSDLFLDEFPFEYIAAVFGVMAATPQHTYLVLTKRPERMLQFFEWLKTNAELNDETQFGWLLCCAATYVNGNAWDRAVGAYEYPEFEPEWPLGKVWLGCSVESQKYADERIPLLLQCPAAVRFLSCEPLLGPLDITPWIPWRIKTNGWNGPEHIHTLPAVGGSRGIDWCIVGGESGRNARPFDIEWARSIVQQCRDAGTACFVKQLGTNPFFIREPSGAPDDDGDLVPLNLRDGKGGRMEEWPADIRVRQWPEVTS